jgi:hypothetical protein
LRTQLVYICIGIAGESFELIVEGCPQMREILKLGRNALRLDKQLLKGLGSIDGLVM